MAVTAESFIAMFPEFSEEDSERLAAFIAMAERQVSTRYFGARADDAILFLTAHKLSTMASATAGPTVLKETVGSMSREYAAGGAVSASNPLFGTPYGVEYLNLIRLIGPLPMVL
jgi:hypothetical protein